MNTRGESSSHNNTTTTTLNMLEFQGYNQEDHQHNQASILSWPLPPPIHNQALRNTDRGGFFVPSSSLNLLPSPAPPPLVIPSLHSSYGDLYSRRASAALQFAYDGGGCNLDPLGLAAGLYNYVGSHDMGRGLSSSSSLPFGSLHAEMGRVSAQEILDAKAQAASKSHSEAERKRRGRINAHLARLRSLLPSTTKTDKASLLAEVIQHVKELKRQTSEIAEESPLPTESDELTVDAANDDDGKFVIKASLCCDDRSDLLPELIKALKALRLRMLKAEITTLGGRVKNVLVITGEENFDQGQQQQSIASIQDALKAVMERAAASHEQPSAVCSIKRQRTTNLSTILEHNSI